MDTWTVEITTLDGTIRRTKTYESKEEAECSAAGWHESLKARVVDDSPCLCGAGRNPATGECSDAECVTR